MTQINILELAASMSRRRALLGAALCCALALPHAATAATNDIFTVAGTGEAGFSGDGDLATVAQLSAPAAWRPPPTAAS